jgi:dihydroorotate dehydrogenase
MGFNLYESVARRALFAFDPERMHETIHACARFVGEWSITRLVADMCFGEAFPTLESTVAGITFPNPVGLAAGFDKHGDMAMILSHVGFGFLEVGTATARPWAGNPKPRIYRLVQDEAIINRMGLNNPGVPTLVRNLASMRRRVPIGISVAKTPDHAVTGAAGVADFIEGAMTAYPHADYLALNISCPNTAEGKTFEDPDLLAALITGLRQRESLIADHLTPIFLKISPDLTHEALAPILEICGRHLINGVIVGNTTAGRDGLTLPDEQIAMIGRGGMSGTPLRERARAMVAHVYRDTRGALPIIACGGISTAEDAYACVRAGASLVQLYTSMIYRGPWTMRNINRGLVALLARDGFATLADAVGADHRPRMTKPATETAAG